MCAPKPRCYIKTVPQSFTVQKCDWCVGSDELRVVSTMQADESVFDGRYTGVDDLTQKACAGAREYTDRVRAGCPGFVEFVCTPGLEFDAGFGGVPTGGCALYRADAPMTVDFLDGQTDFSGTALYTVESGMDTWCHENLDGDEEGTSVEECILHTDSNYVGHVEDATMLRIECMEKTGDSLRDGENKTWKAHLDNPNAFVGLYAMSIRPTLGPAEETYVIVVGNVGAGKATEDMYLLAEEYSEQGKTFKDFVESREYKYTERLAQRNRNRIASQFARKLGLTIAEMGDLFSSEKRLYDQTQMKLSAELTARDSEKYSRGCMKLHDYRQVGQLLATASQDSMDEAMTLLTMWGVTVTNELIHQITSDMNGDDADNPFVDWSASTDTTSTTETIEVPRVGEPFSETLNNRIVVIGASALVYRNAVPQYAVQDGQGVAMTLSPAEGVMIYHGNDRREQAKAPFGNGDPNAGWRNMWPTTSGRVRYTRDVPWALACERASDAAPGFLRWVSTRTDKAKNAHMTGELDTVVPHALTLTGKDMCLFRATDAAFDQNVSSMSTPTLRMQGTTRLDPVAVVLHPQPIRDFPSRRLPS